MKNERIIELDYIRGISCIMVMLYHYTTRYCQSISDLNFPFQFSWGYMAVASFFVLSGFLIMYNSKSDTKFISYIKKKVIRLYPVYWVCMIFTAVICLLFLSSRAVSFKEFIINLTMLNELLKVKSVDGAYWTLLRELIFYVLIGIGLKLNLKNKLQYISTIWLIVLFSLYLISLNYDSIIITGLEYIVIYKYGQHFIAGMMIYYILKAKELKNYIVPATNIIMCAVYNYFALGFYYTVFFVVLVGLVTLFVMNVRFKLWSVDNRVKVALRPISFLASISYTVYLIHQNFGYALINIFEKIGITNELIILVPVILSIFIGWLLNKYVEKPSTKFLSKILIKG